MEAVSRIEIKCCLLEYHSCWDFLFPNIYDLNQNINTLYNNVNILLKYKLKS